MSKKSCVALWLVALLQAGSANAALVSHWVFNNSLNDSVGNNNLTDVGTASYTTTDLPGVAGVTSAVDLSSSAGAKAQNTAPVGLDTPSFTFAAFVKPITPLPNGNNRIMSRDQVSPGNYYFDTDEQGQIYANTWGVGGWTQTTPKLGPFTAGTWQFVAYVVNGAAKTVTVYRTLIGGMVASGSITYTGTINPAGGALYLSGDKDSGIYDYGYLKIADAGWFNEALSAQQIQNIASGGINDCNAPPPTPTPGPLSFINAFNYSTLQAAVDALPATGGVVYLPTGTYNLDAPLNLTNASGIKWVTLVGSGKYNTTITGSGANFTNYEIVDATGAGFTTVRDLTINGTASCLWLSAIYNGSRGGAYFENVVFRADNCSYGVAMIGTEGNCFVNCEFSTGNGSVSNGTCVLLSSIADGLKSKYSTISNNQPALRLNFFGCTLESFSQNSVGLRANGPCSDIHLNGGYFANVGFSAIYLDGTNGAVENVGLSDLRIEGERGQYDLYAVGTVNNVLAQGNNWGTANEVVRYVSVNGSAAVNWNIQNSGLSIYKALVTYPAGPGGNTIFRIDSAKYCKFQNIVCNAYDANSNRYDPPFVYAGGILTGCSIQTDRNPVNFANAANNQGNLIDILYDGGSIRRIYQTSGSASYPMVTNMEPAASADVAGAKTGDIIMLKDGVIAGLPCLAYYTGSVWKKLMPSIAGDLNHDYKITFSDLYLFTTQWLASGCVPAGYCGGADMNMDGHVDFEDFAILAGNWLKGS